MSELISFEIYRTENIIIKGETFTVSFTKRKCKEEYVLFAANDIKTKLWKISYSPETAADFARATGSSLEEKVYSILKNEIECGK